MLSPNTQLLLACAFGAGLFSITNLSHLHWAKFAPDCPQTCIEFRYAWETILEFVIAVVFYFTASFGIHLSKLYYDAAHPPAPTPPIVVAPPPAEPVQTYDPLPGQDRSVGQAPRFLFHARRLRRRGGGPFAGAGRVDTHEPLAPERPWHSYQRGLEGVPGLDTGHREAHDTSPTMPPLDDDDDEPAVDVTAEVAQLAAIVGVANVRPHSPVNAADAPEPPSPVYEPDPALEAWQR